MWISLISNIFTGSLFSLRSFTRWSRCYKRDFFWNVIVLGSLYWKIFHFSRNKPSNTNCKVITETFMSWVTPGLTHHSIIFSICYGRAPKNKNIVKHIVIRNILQQFVSRRQWIIFYTILHYILSLCRHCFDFFFIIRNCLSRLSEVTSGTHSVHLYTFSL